MMKNLKLSVFKSFKPQFNISCSSGVILNKKNVTFEKLVCLTTSRTDSAGGKWRQQNGMPENYNLYGVLNDKADYSYVDKHPIAVAPFIRKRFMREHNLAMSIKQHLKELHETENYDHQEVVFQSSLKLKGDKLK